MGNLNSTDDIVQELHRIFQAKTDIAQVIKNKGVNIPEDTKIDSYSDFIKLIYNSTFTGINKISINGSVENEYFTGLKIYGKSTQDGTPSPSNPIPIVSAGASGSIALRITDGADQSQSLTLSTPNGMPGILVSSGGNCVDSTGQAFTSDYWDFGDGLQHILCGQISSYNGEDITTPYISSTGALTTGAKVVYVLPEPQTQPIPAETLAVYHALTTYADTTVIFTAEPVAGMEATVSFIPNGDEVKY